MSTNLNLSSIGEYVANLEKTALASADPDIQALGAAATNVVASFGELMNKARAVAPKAAALVVNAGIGELAKTDPVFGILIPAEAIIDPAVSGLTAAAENLLLGAPSAAQPVPQPQPE